MLRKSCPLILNTFLRPYTSNLLKCTSNYFVTSSSLWSNEKSVLADPGVIKPDTPEKFQLQKILPLQQVETFDKIQELNTALDVVQFLKNNQKIIVPLHAPLFARILEMIGSDRFGMSVESFTKIPEFENYCKSVNKAARALRPSDALSILKTLRYLKISTNSILSQTLLHVLSKSINELQIHQLIFINYLIRDAPSSPITQALKISLPVVFNANIRAKLNYKNPRSITTALCFALSIHASFKTVDLIAQAALDVKDQLTFDLCKDIAYGFLYNKLKEMNSASTILYTLCMTKMKEEMQNLSAKEVSHMTSLMVNAFLFKNSFYYDEVFLAKVTEYVITNKLKLYEAGSVLRSLNRISYVDVDLLNYVDRLLSQTADLDKMPDGVMIIMTFIASCSDGRYLPPNWNSYEQSIVDYFSKLEDVNVPLLKVAIELMSLDCWHAPLIDRVLAEDFLRRELERKNNNKLDYFNILNIYQAVKTLCKYDVKVLPPDDIINTAIQHQIESKTENNLLPSLELLFGGKSYIVNGIISKFGHYIDNLLILNKNGQPLPIRDEGVKDGQSLQNIVLPANGYAFAIVSLYPTWYCIDGIKLRGRFKMLLDSMATQGVIPVPISTTVWDSLEDSEKLPYLQREIFSRIPGNDSSESSEQVF